MLLASIPIPSTPPIENLPLYLLIGFSIAIATGLITLIGVVSFLLARILKKDKLLMNPEELAALFAFFAILSFLVVSAVHKNTELTKSLDAHEKIIAETKEIASNKILEAYDLNKNTSDFKFEIMDSAIVSGSTQYEESETKTVYDLKFVFDNEDAILLKSNNVTNELIEKLEKK